MIITNKLKLDLQTPGIVPTINAVQNDSYSRNLEITLFSDRKPFVFPEKCAAVIRYKKSDGKGGEYDTLPDGTAAWWAEQNILTVALAPQVLTTPGSVLLSVSLIADGTQLSIFPIRLSVAPIAAAKLAKSEDYFYITGLLPAPVSGKVGQYVRIAAVNDNGRIVSVETADGTGVLPQKGIDYWTDTDQASIVQDVFDTLDLAGYATEEWVEEKLAEYSGCSEECKGLNTTAANLLVTILREGVYSTDQTENIAMLAAEWGIMDGPTLITIVPKFGGLTNSNNTIGYWYNTSHTRCTTNPIAVHMEQGYTYTFSISNSAVYQHGIMIYEGTNIADDFTLGDVSIHSFEGTYIPMIDVGWSHEDYTYTPDGNNKVFTISLRRRDDAIITNEDIETLKNLLVVTKKAI